MLTLILLSLNSVDSDDDYDDEFTVSDKGQSGVSRTGKDIELLK